MYSSRAIDTLWRCPPEIFMPLSPSSAPYPSGKDSMKLGGASHSRGGLHFRLRCAVVIPEGDVVTDGVVEYRGLLGNVAYSLAQFSLVDPVVWDAAD